MMGFKYENNTLQPLKRDAELYNKIQGYMLASVGDYKKEFEKLSSLFQQVFNTYKKLEVEYAPNEKESVATIE